MRKAGRLADLDQGYYKVVERKKDVMLEYDATELEK